MFILDSDHLSLLQHQGSDEYLHLARRLAAHPAEQFFVTIISFHEYAELEGILLDFARAQVLPFSTAAADVYEELRKQRIRVGAMDLRIGHASAEIV